MAWSKPGQKTYRIEYRRNKMAEQVKKPIKITETILRDAHQSLMATTI